ncbi:MAG: hypothetical protein IPH28_21265 [Cytophagaceae bacterium]|nr:hypothetical protein [Cytophagaceae bacterium]
MLSEGWIVYEVAIPSIKSKLGEIVYKSLLRVSIRKNDLKIKNLISLINEDDEIETTFYLNEINSIKSRNKKLSEELGTI